MQKKRQKWANSHFAPLGGIRCIGVINMLEFFKSHRRSAFLGFFLWLLGALAGIYISFKNPPAEGLREYILGIAEAEKSFGRVFANGLGANLIFVFLMLLSSLFVPFMPIAVLTLVFRGFSASLGSALLIRLFSFKGAMAAVGALVLPLAFALPIQFMAFISSADMARSLAAAGRYISPNRGEITAQLLRMLLIFSALCAISAAEAVISPYVFEIVRI